MTRRKKTPRKLQTFGYPRTTINGLKRLWRWNRAIAGRRPPVSAKRQPA